jgi:hypothetical protein
MFSGGRDRLTSLGYATAPVGVAAGGLPSIPARAQKAYITIEANPVRWRDDGTPPTAAEGHPIAAGGVLEYEGTLTSLRLIRSGGADADLNVSYYR